MNQNQHSESENLNIIVEKKGNETYFFLQQNGLEIGTGTSTVLSENQSIMSDIEIKEEHRNKGFGQLFIRSIIDFTESKEIFVTTIEPKIYLKLGFVVLDQYPDFVDHTHEDCKRCSPKDCVAMIYRR